MDQKKEYVKPEIIHELELETRAGSPIGPGSLPTVPELLGIPALPQDK